MQPTVGPLFGSDSGVERWWAAESSVVGILLIFFDSSFASSPDLSPFLFTSHLEGGILLLSLP